MRDYHKLDVWVKGHALALDIHRLTHAYPRREIFGLAAQMRGAARSIPANVAEGCGRDSRKDFARFLDIASGSANELAYYVELSRDLGYLMPDESARLTDRISEVGRMLVGLRATVRRTP
ncbi:MAG TPA: four helix bundle protein [Longimicrobiales bacterium]|nr:four helix bundle protein [Longimicrobiales bacterium]